MAEPSTYTCPDCKAEPGEPCDVPIAGVDTTGWEHDARILAPVLADLSAAPATTTSQEETR